MTGGGRAVVGPRGEWRGGVRNLKAAGEAIHAWRNVVTGVPHGPPYQMEHSTEYLLEGRGIIPNRACGKAAARVGELPCQRVVAPVGEVAVRCGGQSSHTTARPSGPSSGENKRARSHPTRPQPRSIATVDGVDIDRDCA